MNKVFSVVFYDFLQVVGTRTFILSVALMPVLFLGMIGVQLIAQKSRDITDKKIGLFDPTGELFERIRKQSQERNRYNVFERQGKQVKARYLPIAVEDLGQTHGELEIALSEKVRARELFAFVIVGRDIINPDSGDDDEISYYSATPTAVDLPNWLSRTINGIVEEIRFAEEGLDPRLITRLSNDIPVNRRGLSRVTPDGRTIKAEDEDPFRVFGVPFGALMLLFVTVNMSSPMMLNTVMEEKMNRIAEILVASISPFQLMLGKLLAATLVGLTFAAVYLLGIVGLLTFMGKLAIVPIALFFWFLLFLVLSLWSFGAVWAAIGAACSELKDTQNFTGVIVLLLVVPMVMAMPVIESPNSPFSQLVSLFPPFTPMIMLLRLAIPPGPAHIQVILGLVLTIAYTAGCIWFAGRVFRVGMLAQGKAPGFRELMAWVFRS